MQTPVASATPELPDTARAHFAAFFKSNREYLQALTCLDATGRPLFRVTWKDNDANFQTENIMAAEAAHEPAVLNLKTPHTLRSPVKKAAYGASLLVNAPVLYPPADDDARAIGAVVAEFKLGDVVKEADEADSAEDAATASAGGAQGQRDRRDRLQHERRLQSHGRLGRDALLRGR